MIWPEGMDYESAKILVMQEQQIERDEAALLNPAAKEANKLSNSEATVADSRPPLSEFIITEGDSDLPRIAPPHKS